MKVQERFKSIVARMALHLCILVGAVSIVLEKAPHLFPQSNKNVDTAEVISSDELLAQAISETQKKPSVLKASLIKEDEEGKETKLVETFEDLLQLKRPTRAKQLVNSFSADKLALWSVFSNLSTYSAMTEILSQPIKAYERETLRSESFGLTAGFDQIIYKIHLENGGTSLVMAQMDGDSVIVSLFKAPSEMDAAYQVQRFKDGLWVESRELLRAQVEGEILKTKHGSAVVLSASVGL